MVEKGKRLGYSRELMKLLEQAGRNEGMRPVNAFERFLEMAFCAIRGQTLAPNSTAWEENEANYERCLGRLQQPEATRQLFAEALGLTALAMEERYADFLGPIWMEIGSSAQLGQFFTPHELCKMIALMSIEDPRALMESKGRPYITCHEPAAGMGGMVLAAAEVMQEQGLDPALNCFWQMIELDYTVFKGCYVQTALAGIAGILHHGNTLTLEIRSSHFTPAGLLFMRHHRLTALPGDEPEVEVINPQRVPENEPSPA
jgi:Type I restriction-modification system methyltransferase subunit